MSTLEDRYRGLLRWYPRSWRQENGEALIGTALDAAEAEARIRPTAAEVREMILHGVAQRATVRVAFGAAVMALLCATVSQVVLVTSIETVAQWGGGWLPLALGALSSLLQTAALLALLRHSGRLHPGRFVPGLLLSVVAWAFTFLSAWSWSIGFDRADAGLAATPFTAGLWLFLLCGWIVGGITVGTVVLDLGRPLPAAPRAAAAAVAGAAIPLAVGAMMMAASAGLLSSLVLIAVCARMMTVRTESATLPAAAAAAPFLRTGRRLTRRSRVIVLASAVSGLASVVFALTGGMIVPVVDSTRAMQVGLAAGALSGIPLLCIGATRLAQRHPTRRIAIWCGVMLAGAGVAIEAAYALSGAGASGDMPWAAVAPAAAGLGLLTWALAPVSRGIRLVLAVAVGAASFFPLWFALTAAGLLFPAIAAIVAAHALPARRRPKRSRMAEPAVR